MLRREKLCRQEICPDAPDGDHRCAECPLTKLEALDMGPMGNLLARVIEVDSYLMAGFTKDLDALPVDELTALLVFRDERNQVETENNNASQRTNASRQV